MGHLTEQTVAGLQGLPQPEEWIDDWQRALDVMTDVHLEGGRGKCKPTFMHLLIGSVPPHGW
jgi:hypothetical protein